MAKTNDNKFYFWGSNDYNECFSKSESEYVTKPLLFDWEHFIKTEYQILNIYLGFCSTLVLIGNTKQ